MASTSEFVDYVCDQISLGGEISYKKMFGEYGIYCDGKIIGLICNNQFYLKKTKFGEEELGADVEEAPPYTGAKPQYVIESLDDKEFLGELIKGTTEELPMPKPKKKKIKE